MLRRHSVFGLESKLRVMEESYGGDEMLRAYAAPLMSWGPAAAACGLLSVACCLWPAACGLLRGLSRGLGCGDA